MTIEPILAASPAVQLHVWAALTAVVVGASQFATRRGSRIHRTVGWTWVVLMAVTALSSFFIHQIQLVGLWSPIHLLSVYTLVILVLAIRAARQNNLKAHGTMLGSLFLFGLIGAGAFTLLPGRIMSQVLFG